MPTDARRSALSSAIRHATPSARGLVEILRVPHAAGLAAASWVARLPRGMAALAIVLLVHDATGSYAAAGAAGAALSIDDAGVSPLQGRLVDRLGPARVLVPSAVVYTSALTALALLGTQLGPLPAIILAGVGGAAFPPVSASMKTLWPRLAGGESLVFAAYAVESLIQQSLFLLGPLLVAGLVAFGSYRLALIATAALALAGTLAFAASPVSRAWRGVPGRRGRSLGLRGAAVRALVAITLIQSVALGARTVAVPAFAARHGHPDAAGVLLAVLNLGALIGVPLGAGSRPAGDPVVRYRLFSALLAVGAAPVVLAATIEQAALLLALSGLFIAPTAAASYVLMDRVSDPRGRTEAFTWMSTAVAGGTAIGAAAGATTEALGVTAALLLAFLAVAAAALAATALSDTLRSRAAFAASRR